jgi:sugar/nucleoside kinase (ribokinase family)
MNARLFHVSSLGGDLGLMKKIIARAVAAKAKVYWNPGNNELTHGAAALRPILSRVDLVSLNREEAAALTGKKDADLRGIVRAMQKLVVHSVITDGPKGAYAVSPGEVLHAAVVPAKRINLTGAGDAFTSGYAIGLLHYHDARTALALGTLNATGVVQNMGAKAGILHHMPSKHELSRVKIKKISF